MFEHTRCLRSGPLRHARQIPYAEHVRGDRGRVSARCSLSDPVSPFAYLGRLTTISWFRIAK